MASRRSARGAATPISSIGRRHLLGQGSQEGSSVSSKRAPVHAGEGRRSGGCQAFNLTSRVRRVRPVVHGLLKLHARPEDVCFGDRGGIVPTLGEEIPTQQRTRRLLEEVTALPAVGNVGRVE